MAGIDRDDLLHLVLQFLDKQNYKKTLHSLEGESKVFFNLRYFEEKVIKGEWNELEKYLSPFIKLNDNEQSVKIFFKIRYQKYLETLDRGDKKNALDILTNELKVFAVFNKHHFQDTVNLIVLDNIRKAPHLSNYVDAKTARTSLVVSLRSLIMQNPLLCNKLQIPTLAEGSLQTKINQSLKWQHMRHCENPVEPPIIRTLFVDHTCEQLNDSPGQKSIASSSGEPMPIPSMAQAAGYDVACTSGLSVVSEENQRERATEKN